MSRTLVFFLVSLTFLPTNLDTAQEPPTTTSKGDLRGLLGWLEHLKLDIIDPGEGAMALSNPDHYVAHQLHDVAEAAVEKGAFTATLMEIQATLCSQDQAKFRTVATQQVQRALTSLERDISKVDKVTKLMGKDHLVALGMDLRDAITQLQAQIRKEFLVKETATGA